MIGYLQAKKILENSKINIKIQTLSTEKSLNRVSAINVYSNVNYPAANNTSFDGYAINSKDTILLNQKKKNFLKLLKQLLQVIIQKLVTLKNSRQLRL